MDGGQLFNFYADYSSLGGGVRKWTHGTIFTGTRQSHWHKFCILRAFRWWFVLACGSLQWFAIQSCTRFECSVLHFFISPLTLHRWHMRSLESHSFSNSQTYVQQQTLRYIEQIFFSQRNFEENSTIGMNSQLTRTGCRSTPYISSHLTRSRYLYSVVDGTWPLKEDIVVATTFSTEFNFLFFFSNFKLSVVILAQVKAVNFKNWH